MFIGLMAMALPAMTSFSSKLVLSGSVSLGIMIVVSSSMNSSHSPPFSMSSSNSANIVTNSGPSAPSSHTLHPQGATALFLFIFSKLFFVNLQLKLPQSDNAQAQCSSHTCSQTLQSCLRPLSGRSCPRLCSHVSECLLLRTVTQESVITNSKQLKPKKSADSFKDNCGNRNWNFVKLINEVLQRWKNYGNFQSSTFDTVARRKFIEDQNTILELSGRVQELQNEVNCMNDSKDFQDAESIRSGNSHVTSRLVSFPPHPIPEGMLSRSFGVPSRREGAAKHLGHTWYIGKRFCKSRCVIISTLSSRIESMEFID